MTPGGTSEHSVNEPGIEVSVRTEDRRDLMAFLREQQVMHPSLSFSELGSSAGRRPTLHDQALGEQWLVLKDAVVVIVPVLLLWLGKGKRMRVRHGKRELELTNYSAKEAEQLLRSLRDPD